MVTGQSTVGALTDALSSLGRAVLVLGSDIVTLAADTTGRHIGKAWSAGLAEDAAESLLAGALSIRGQTLLPDGAVHHTLALLALRRGVVSLGTSVTILSFETRLAFTFSRSFSTGTRMF